MGLVHSEVENQPGLCSPSSGCICRHHRKELGNPPPFPRMPELDRIPAPFTCWGGTELSSGLAGPVQAACFLLATKALGSPRWDPQAPLRSEQQSGVGAASSHLTRTGLSLFPKKGFILRAPLQVCIGLASLLPRPPLGI